LVTAISKEVDIGIGIDTGDIKEFAPPPSKTIFKYIIPAT